MANVDRTDTSKAKAKKAGSNEKQKRGRGRPKGSKNKNNRNVVLNAEMTQVQAMLQKLLKLIGDTLQPIYFVYDGAFGNNAAVQMTRQSRVASNFQITQQLCLVFQVEWSLFRQWEATSLW